METLITYNLLYCTLNYLKERLKIDFILIGSSTVSYFKALTGKQDM